jgi:hypothetical protein
LAHAPLPDRWRSEGRSSTSRPRKQPRPRRAAGDRPRSNALALVRTSPSMLAPESRKSSALSTVTSATVMSHSAARRITVLYQYLDRDPNVGPSMLAADRVPRKATAPGPGVRRSEAGGPAPRAKSPEETSPPRRA